LAGYWFFPFRPASMVNVTTLASAALENNDFTYCYRWGAVGSQLTYFIVWGPTLLWSAYGGYATNTREVYYLLTWMMWWITAGVVYILRQFSGWSESRPHPECTSDDFGGPSYSTSILAHYLVAMVFHQLYTGHLSSSFTNAWLLLLCIVVPVWLWYTGNASVAQLVQGAGIGSMSGTLFMFLLIFFLLPRFPFIVGETWERVTGLRHGPGLVMTNEYVKPPSQPSAPV
jgi:hypothetical protein